MYESISPQRKENGNRNNSHPEICKSHFIVLVRSDTGSFNLSSQQRYLSI